MKTNWKYISLFLILSVGIAAPVHLGYIDKIYEAITGEWIIKDWVYIIAGIGPLLAGIITLFFHKNVSHRITIWGEKRVKNILIALLPVSTFSIFGLENSQGLNIHYYGFVYASINLIYAFFEEFGWRMYLQNALESINKNWKYILIGIIWWFWHMRFDTHFDLLIFPVICIFGGYLLGKLADDTKSILPVVTIHTLIILLSNSGAMTLQKMTGAGLTIIGWLIIEQIWKRKKHITKAIPNKGFSGNLNDNTRSENK